MWTAVASAQTTTSKPHSWAPAGTEALKLVAIAIGVVPEPLAGLAADTPVQAMPPPPTALPEAVTVQVTAQFGVEVMLALALIVAVAPLMSVSAGALTLTARLQVLMTGMVSLEVPELLAAFESLTCCGSVAVRVTFYVNVWLLGLVQVRVQLELLAPLTAGCTTGLAVLTVQSAGTLRVAESEPLDAPARATVSVSLHVIVPPVAAGSGVQLSVPAVTLGSVVVVIATVAEAVPLLLAALVSRMCSVVMVTVSLAVMVWLDGLAHWTFQSTEKTCDRPPPRLYDGNEKGLEPAGVYVQSPGRTRVTVSVTSAATVPLFVTVQELLTLKFVFAGEVATAVTVQPLFEMSVVSNTVTSGQFLWTLS
jgi:hypothetical protein